MLLSKLIPALLLLTVAGCGSLNSTSEDRPQTASAAAEAPAPGTVSYRLGSQAQIDQLIPAADKARFYLPQKSTAEVIAYYVTDSLRRDRIIGFKDSADVTLIEADEPYYRVSFAPRSGVDPAVAEAYAGVHRQWMSEELAGQAYNGAQLCRQTSDCWDPDGTGEWDLFLPLGLPMVNQKAVMLIHYPPYVSLQQGDYLDNNTIARWDRLLMSNGVPTGDVPLYENIVDVIPLAAPGSGQSQYLPESLAANYFNKKSDDKAASRYYVTPMLDFNLNPVTLQSGSSTLPVVVFGSEARSFFAREYLSEGQAGDKNQDADKPLGILQTGRVTLSSNGKSTAFLGANHPIKAVYERCEPANPGDTTILDIEVQDLVSACYIKQMSDNPDGDTDKVLASCKTQWLNASPDSAEAELICINAKIDLSSFGACSWENAVSWCKQHENNACASIEQQRTCTLD